MGSISSMLPSSAASTSDVAALVDSLESLAEEKANGFKAAITDSLLAAGTGIDRTIPISTIDDFTYETHAYNSQNANAIESTITSSINDFVQGGTQNILNGITNILTTAITALFGDTSASEQEVQRYFVATEGIALVRLDFMGWKRSVSSTSITSTNQQVSAFVMMKSTVDVEKLDFDTFLTTYQDVLAMAAPPLTADQITAELTSVKQVFQDFKASSS